MVASLEFLSSPIHPVENGEDSLVEVSTYHYFNTAAYFWNPSPYQRWVYRMNAIIINRMA